MFASFPSVSLGTGLHEKLCFESKNELFRKKRSRSFWHSRIPKLELGNERNISLLWSFIVFGVLAINISPLRGCFSI